MGKKLFVGNLPFGATEDQLRQHFTGAGNVDSVKIIIDRNSGRSKGFGFVEMSNDDEATSAIETLNGSSFLGRNISVSEARPMQEGGGGSRGGNGGGGGRGGYGGGGGGGGRPPRHAR